MTFQGFLRSSLLCKKKKKNTQKGSIKTTRILAGGLPLLHAVAEYPKCQSETEMSVQISKVYNACYVHS